MVWLLNPIDSTQRPRSQGFWCHRRLVLHPYRRWSLSRRLDTVLCQWNSGCQYKWTENSDVMDKLTHFNMHQKADLFWVLQENFKMLDGTLGIYPHQKVHIKLIPNTKPVLSCPFQLLWRDLKTFTVNLIISLRSEFDTTYNGKWMNWTHICHPEIDCHICWGSDLFQLKKSLNAPHTLLIYFTKAFRE